MNVEIYQGDNETDLVGKAGETFRVWFQFIEEVGNVPIHLGSVTSAKAQFKRSPEDASPLFELTLVDGLTIDAANGRIEVYIKDETTVNKAGNAFWDLRLGFENGDVYYLCGGTHALGIPVTKP